MATLYGKMVGEEARYRNKTVLLGPGVNLYRTPLNGRNFEYMGEDPYLASQMCVPYIQGPPIQWCGMLRKTLRAQRGRKLSAIMWKCECPTEPCTSFICVPFHAAVTEGAHGA